MKRLVRWVLNNYTIVLLYVGAAGLGWHYDVRLGLVLGTLLPVAFVMGYGAGHEAATSRRPRALPGGRRAGGD
jgi:hypothetical protein